MTRGMGMDGDPFVTGLFGGLPRMATSASETFSEATTVRESPSARQTSLSVPATKSSFARLKGMPGLLGVIPATGETIKPVSSAPSSATGVRTSRRSLSDKLDKQAGRDAAKLPSDSSYLKNSDKGDHS